jgi:SnoaL-like domain
MRLWIALGVAVLLLQSAATEQLPARPATLTVMDYAEIKRVVGRYNLGWDNTARIDNGAQVAKSFTADAIFHSPGPEPWLGSAGIAAQATKARSGISHWVSNLIIDPAPDGGAISWSSLLLTNVTESGRPVTFTGGGILHEAFVKTSEGWRITYRRYEPVGRTPTPNWPKLEQGLFVPAPDPNERPRTQRLTSSDYIAIEQLYIRNNVGLDSNAEEGQRFAGTFTPDGVMVSEDSRDRVEGKMLAQLPRTVLKEPALHTWMTNLAVEASREGAIGHADILNATLVPGPAGPNARHTISGGRRYTDVLVKTSEGWRFKKRTYKSYAAAP